MGIRTQCHGITCYSRIPRQAPSGARDWHISQWLMCNRLWSCRASVSISTRRRRESGIIEGALRRQSPGESPHGQTSPPAGPDAGTRGNTRGALFKPVGCHAGKPAAARRKAGAGTERRLPTDRNLDSGCHRNDEQKAIGPEWHLTVRQNVGRVSALCVTRQPLRRNTTPASRSAWRHGWRVTAQTACLTRPELIR